jgi:glycogen debranching enzyme
MSIGAPGDLSEPAPQEYNPLGDGDHAVPSSDRHQLVLVDGRTFVVSDESGQLHAGSHGLIHDDLRYLSRCTVTLDAARLELLAAGTPSPLSAVVVSRAVAPGGNATALLTRRRWVADGLREDLGLRNPSTQPQSWTLRLQLAADFAHVFEVKAGRAGVDRLPVPDAGGWRIDHDGDNVWSRIRLAPVPDQVDLTSGTFSWHVQVPARGEWPLVITVEPVEEGAPSGLAFPIGTTPTAAIPMGRLSAWRAGVPRVVSTDPRLGRLLDQSLSDLASLRIVDAGHVDRAVVAAGAPWFMTLFGRDSLLTSWMALPFEPGLAAGVLASLADLQGRRDDPVADEQPGKILHELRRHGGGGPFASRHRYYGTVDATPLFVMLAAEAQRWGALAVEDHEWLSPAVTDALDWLQGQADGNGDGFVDYRRGDPAGLVNQGWKDSWDGVTFADGTVAAAAPIALAEVQGYAYAALLGAAELATVLPVGRDAGELRQRAAELRTRFNERFWDERGWFVTAIDGEGRPADSLTTNPGHALWCGIAEPELAARHLDWFTDPALWTGWGLRTLATTMGAFDPLSYHNGSVWPHDSAICAAGAARYGRWDVVDLLRNGALDAAMRFGGRPPELFAGLSRDDVPMPVAYPSSCSPQAWAAASVLLHLRSMLGLEPADDGSRPVLTRPDLTGVPDLTMDHIHCGARTFTVAVHGALGVISAATDPPP